MASLPAGEHGSASATDVVVDMVEGGAVSTAAIEAGGGSDESLSADEQLINAAAASQAAAGNRIVERRMQDTFQRYCRLRPQIHALDSVAPAHDPESGDRTHGSIAQCTIWCA
jgi:hypothetical protein